MNILIVHNHYQIPGGEDTVVANEKKLLEDYGHRVTLYTRNNCELKQMPFFRKLALPFTTIFNPRTYMDIRDMIRKQKIEIVHVHNTLNLISPSVYYAACSRKVPVVQTIHNFRMLCPGATFYRDGHICEDCLEKGLKCAVKHGCYRGSRLQTLACVISMKLHRMTGIYRKLNYICLTEFNKEKLLKLKQIKEGRVYVKPNFTFDIEEKKERGEFYLYIGRIEEIKGVALLIEAFSRMPEKKLVLAGTGSEVHTYKDAAAERGLVNIEFTGFKEREKLAGLLKYAKAVIVASQCYETFGMIIAEAFACRTPVIVGDIGNIGGLVEDGVDGVKFQYDSSDALVEAVERFEQLNAVTLGENAYRKYRERFAANSNYKGLEEVYRSISGGHGSETESLTFRLESKNREHVSRYVYVGRIEKLKGIDLLLRAWKQVEDNQEVNAPLLIVCGMGPMEEWCKNYIEINGLKTVEMRGFVPNEEIRRILAESRALILPTQCFEGFPMTILEAYGVGIPVICSDLGNAGSMVVEGVTGLKFRYDDLEDLADKIRMFEDRPFTVKRETGRQYSASTNYLQLMEIYKDAVSRESRRE